MRRETDDSFQRLAALTRLTDIGLHARTQPPSTFEQTAPGLLAWLDSACLWQLQRRNGYHFELQPPEAAIPPEEDAGSIDAVIAMRDAFAHDSLDRFERLESGRVQP